MITVGADENLLAGWLEHPPVHEPEPGWGQSLSDGAAGVALLHIARARAGCGRWQVAHRWAAAATRTPVSANHHSGLFYGAPAVAYALHTAGHPAYTNALHTLDRQILTLTRSRVAAAHERIDQSRPATLGEYDLISGLTGLGCYLLARYPTGTELRQLLGYLVRLTEPTMLNREPVPGWWTAHDPADEPSARVPGGHGNLGMAHGIAGPLALLATATKRGIGVDGQVEAISCIVTWLEQWRKDRHHRAWWPEWITLDEHRTGQLRRPEPPRPSWCYGTPGIARALQLAGQATDNTEYQRTAEQAMLGCVTDLDRLARLVDASLCHGWAGLVHTVCRMAADAPTDDLATQLPHLRRQLVRRRSGLNSPGLLEGHAGVALTLHTTADQAPSGPAWDACLLTSG